MREENANLKHDTNVLINVISSARTHGRWDVRIVIFYFCFKETISF